MTTCVESLKQRNEELFQDKFPHVLAALKSLGDPISELVIEGDKAVNIKIDGQNLYPENFEDVAKQQVESYFENPDRIGFTDPSHCNLSPVSRKLLKYTQGFLISNNITRLAPYPLKNIGYTFIFGIGLGGHLLEVIKRSEGINIALIEPIPEFLTHSFSTIDWQEIVDFAEESGSDISFILGQAPYDIVETISMHMRRSMNTFLDGSYAYIHYPSWTIIEARKLLNEEIKSNYISSGFFEDEILMMTNTYDNFKNHDFHILNRQPVLEQQKPVFIVGSGPSLDKSLPKIIELRDKVILLSSGSSSLDILLKNGLTPDFHVEVENSHPLVVNLQKLAETYDLSSITFIGSTTVNPLVGKIFKKKFFFFRPQLSPMYILNPGIDGLIGTDPLVANTGFSSMLACGFQNIYLFGVDCGKRRGAGHHSKQAVYYKDDYDNFLKGFGKETLDDGYNQVVPGNFGGEILTTKLFNISRAAFTYSLRNRTAKRYNCSDGAKIEGITPLSPFAIKLPATSQPLDKIMSSIEEQMSFYEKGQVFDKTELAEGPAECDYLEEKFLEVYENDLVEDIDFPKFEKHIIDLRYLENKKQNPAYIICHGSIRSMIRLGAFFGSRFEDEEEHKKFIDFFLKEYKDLCLWMFKETKKMLTEMAEGKDELSEIGVTKEG
ncbi:MAG: DUF115 domain-containing protein [Rhodospirillales bacterium]|nr:DUF115 domain-containing protein [Rhodospirillales bacterium]